MVDILEKKILIFLAFAVFVFAGCTLAKDFSYGIKQVDIVNSRYNTTMETYPKSTQKIDLMIRDMEEIKKIRLEAGQDSFNYVVDYRILNLEAEKFYIQGESYENSGTTKNGFGCKQRPLIIESVAFRNSSALKGFEAVGLLREFIGKYSEDAKSVGLSEKNALFLNVTFYAIAIDAEYDSNVINYFCPQNVTLELYRQEIGRETNFSKDYIGRLSYMEAVDIWKKINGII